MSEEKVNDLVNPDTVAILMKEYHKEVTELEKVQERVKTFLKAKVKPITLIGQFKAAYKIQYGTKKEAEAAVEKTQELQRILRALGNEAGFAISVTDLDTGAKMVEEEYGHKVGSPWWQGRQCWLEGGDPEMDCPHAPNTEAYQQFITSYDDARTDSQRQYKELNNILQGLDNDNSIKDEKGKKKAKKKAKKETEEEETAEAADQDDDEFYPDNEFDGDTSMEDVDNAADELSENRG